MAVTNVKVIVSAVDNASNVLTKLGKNIEKSLSKQTGANVGVLTQATAGLKGALGGVAGAAGTAGIAIAGVAAAVAGAVIAMQPFIKASIEMQNSIMGLSTVSRAFGVDASSANNAAKTLAQDGLMTFSDAATGLKNLLATGFSLPEAIALMNTFKDAAAFNRQGTLEFGEAIVGATIGLKNQNSILIDNVGITKNLSVMVKEAGLTMEDWMNMTNDATVRQKILNEILQEGAVFEGDSARAADTLGGKLSQLGTQSFMLKAAIGDALSPIVEQFASLISGYLVGALNWVNKNMYILQTGVLALSTVLAAATAGIVGFAKIIIGAISSIFSLSFDPLVESIKSVGTDLVSIAVNTQNKMTDIANKAAGLQSDAYEKSANKIKQTSSKKKDKVVADMEKETEAFEREMEKRERRFREQLADMIYAHLEKKQELIKDLEDENKAYEENMKERADDFQEKMDDMVKAHEEKVADIKEQIAEEDSNFALRMDDMKFEYDQNMADLKDSHEDKVRSIEDQIQDELNKGRSANMERVADLQASLEEEKAEYTEKVDSMTTEYERETAKLQEEHNKRLAAFQAELLAEETAHLAAIAKADEERAKETAKIIADHQARVDDYNAKIKAEEDILNKHQADVAAVKDKAKEDDITRLKNQYEQERKDAQEDHERKLVEIQERGTAEGGTYGGAISSALTPKLEEIKSNMTNAGKTAGENFARGIVEGAANAGKGLITGFVSNLGAQIRAMPEYIRNVVLPKIGLSDENIQKWLMQPHWLQSGGVVPGEVGEPVPILAHGQERVIPSNLARAGVGAGANGLTFNVNIGLYAGTETEKRNIAKTLYSALLQVAQSQNKSVAEMMGG